MSRYEIHTPDEDGALCVEEAAGENWLEALSRHLARRGAPPLSSTHALDFGEDGVVTIRERGGRQMQVRPAQLLEEGPPRAADLPWVEAPLCAPPLKAPSISMGPLRVEAEALLEAALEAGGEGGAVYLLDLEGARLRPLAARPSAAPRGLSLGRLVEALKAGRAVGFMDPEPEAGAEAARSALCAPLMWAGRALGVLELWSTRPMAFTPADERRAAALCEAAAEAIAALRPR